MKPLTVGAVGVSTVVESLRVPMAFAEFLPQALQAREVLEAARPWLEPRFADLATGPWLLVLGRTAGDRPGVVLEPVRQVDPEIGPDPLNGDPVASAEKMRGDIGRINRDADLFKLADQGAGGDNLAIHQNAVAIENHETDIAQRQPPLYACFSW